MDNKLVITQQYKSYHAKTQRTQGLMTENEIAKITMAATYPKILLTYLRMTNLKLELLVNLNVDLIPHMRDGFKRIANNL
ncbi:MAG: hypothetical protein HY738_08655 [Bacteroidia bacterium]|nr:hypothetical protein [Bacteroidia bacterium]